jgi:hypothetical protein
MSSLESSIAAADVAPIAGLQFKLPGVSDFVTSREEVSFFPSGNTFAPTGVRTLRVSASGNGFADLSTAVLSFTVKENNVAALKPLSANGSSFFSELRLLASGVELERIGGSCSYGRINELLSRTIPSDKRVCEASMAFGIPTGARAGAGVATVGEYDQMHALQRGGILDSNQLAINTELKIYHKPLFGLAAQSCYMPLWALTGNGLTFEFLLVGSGAEAVDNTAPHTSTNWTISNVSLAMDILTVDGELMSSYSSHLLNQKSLVVPYRTYTTLSFPGTTSTDVVLQIPRSFTRCNQVWVVMAKNVGADLHRKDANYFPALGSTALESWIQVGTTRYPQGQYGPGLRSHFFRMQKALGQLTSGFHTMSNTLESFSDDSMIICFDLEKLGGGGAAMSGLNTHGGNMTINLKGLATAGNTCDRIDVLIWHDSILSISDGSCSVAF